MCQVSTYYAFFNEKNALDTDTCERSIWIWTYFQFWSRKLQEINVIWVNWQSQSTAKTWISSGICSGLFKSKKHIKLTLYKLVLFNDFIWNIINKRAFIYHVDDLFLNLWTTQGQNRPLTRLKNRMTVKESKEN
jgi:hypothetical protein